MNIKTDMVVKGVPDIPNVYYYKVFDVQPTEYAVRIDEFIDELELFLTHYRSRYTSNDYVRDTIIKIKV